MGHSSNEAHGKKQAVLQPCNLQNQAKFSFFTHFVSSWNAKHWFNFKGFPYSIFLFCN